MKIGGALFTGDVSFAISEVTQTAISIVIPCLDEAGSVGICVDKAFAGLRSGGLRGEVIVADNGSRDESAAIAAQHGANVIHVPNRGYGNAIRGGIESAAGEFIIIGDADNTYDFSEIPKFLDKWHEGYDLVIGNRFQGEIKPGAMPWHHRYLGTPAISAIVNWTFGTGMMDVNSGMRGFTRSLIRQLRLRSTGMEFASECLIRAAQKGAKICEVPISLWPGSKNRQPHLRSFRDGCRHLRMIASCARRKGETPFPAMP